MNGTARHQLRNRLPKGYFGDCQLSNFEAAARASSGGSQAQHTSAPADTHAAASFLPANDEAGVCTDRGLGVAGGGERSHAAGNARLAESAAHDTITFASQQNGSGCTQNRDACGNLAARGEVMQGAETMAVESASRPRGAGSNTSPAEGLSLIAQQLHAARVISGRATQ